MSTVTANVYADNGENTDKVWLWFSDKPDVYYPFPNDGDAVLMKTDHGLAWERVGYSSDTAATPSDTILETVP